MNGHDDLLRIDGLSVEIDSSDGPVHALRAASIHVARGEILGLVGESGGGKSMLAMTVPGLLPPAARITAGSVTLNGINVLALDENGRQALRRDQVGVVFQHPMRALNPRLTIRAQIYEALRREDRPRRAAKALELMDWVGIDCAHERLSQYPHELSGGLAQRVLIGLALARTPGLMIADEPTTALDVNVQAQILDLIDRLRRELRLSVLLVSHDLDVIADRCDRVGVLRAGEVVESGSVEQVLRAPQHDYTIRLLEARPAARLATRLAEKDRQHLESDASNGVAPALLEGIGINRTFGRHRPIWGDWHSRKPAVHEASVHVRRGESVGIVGESGSGKTSLARILVGLERADRGQVLYEGKPLELLDTAARRHFRRAVQFVFQDSTSSLDPRMTIAESIAEPLINERLTADALAGKVNALLDEVGLDRTYAGRKPGQLSGGQRQRVNIARSLALDPALIIADEPVSALDVSVQATILNLLRRLQSVRGMASIIISHDLTVIGMLCDRVVVMYRGEIVETGPVAQILTAPSHAYTRELIAAMPGRSGPSLPPPAIMETLHAT